MKREDLIVSAIIDKFGNNLNIYSSNDIIVVSGISDEEAKKLFESFKLKLQNEISLTV